MSEYVERKKSYRWVSAGQASYDGADWNSSDESSSEEIVGQRTVKRGDTISKLPALPKLNYDDDGDDDNDDNYDDDGEENKIIDTEVPSQKQWNVPERTKPPPLVTENNDESTSQWESPRLGTALSRNSSKSSVQVRRTPVNEDLENLMAQISKEMTPKIEQPGKFGEGSDSDEFDQISPVGLEKGSFPGSHSEDELAVSKDGYFSKFIETNDGNDYISDTRSSIQSPVERTIQTPSLSAGEIDRDEEPGDEVARTSDKDDVPLAVGNGEAISPVVGGPQSHSPSSEGDAYFSTDEEDDALSYTESIKYQARISLSAGRQSIDSEKDVMIPEVDEDTEGLDEEIRVSKSGYFSKMVQSDSDSDNSSASGLDSIADDDSKTIPETIPETVKSSEDSRVDETDEEAVLAAGNADDSKLAKEDGTSSQAATLDRDQDMLDELHESASIDDQHNDDEYETDGGEPESGSDDVPEDAKEPLSTRQSINLGKWKPDTGAFRNNFVQETSNNPPPGFVYDETGKLVDLTPSSMKPRVVSTYSEVESSWNAFPSEGNEDLETVRDTKTLYDNNTIYNVPGIISNNQNLPPLPSIASGAISNESSDEPKSLRTSTSTGLTLDGESRREPLQTHFKEVFTLPPANTKDIARVTGVNAVPSMDLNKVVSSKNSHAYKIEQLRAYSKELVDYDSGIQTWLSYTLKSSSKTDRDFIFDEYKVSKHVKDAYAHADELSKKHIVSNTVANVNQNVTHLTKKVFAHSKKSRGLFSSIGKKRV